MTGRGGKPMGWLSKEQDSGQKPGAIGRTRAVSPRAGRGSPPPQQPQGGQRQLERGRGRARAESESLLVGRLSYQQP
jgi:hypothetical protein